MECRRTIFQNVFPLFYEVDRSDVSRQQGAFGEAFDDLVQRITVEEDTLKSWRRALRKATKMLEFSFVDLRGEIVDVKKTVERVKTDLKDYKEWIFAGHQVGVESRVQDVIGLLKSHQSDYPLLVGIWGMVGIGKTSIAEAVYNQIGRDFEAKSFLRNVREVAKRHNGLVSLQQQLLFHICKTRKTMIGTIKSGEKVLRERLQERKVLVILDDVTEPEQLNALCGSREWFGSGSIIIITTRDRRLLMMLGVDHVYRVPELDQKDSLEYFSWRVFHNASPLENFDEISTEIVAHAGGLPLALGGLASLMFGRYRDAWESLLQNIKRSLIPEVKKILEKSFDDLQDMEKIVFLDIACFYIGMDRNEVIQKYTSPTEVAISVLQDKSLVTVDENNKLGMHILLQQMGREIQREESKQVADQPKIYDVFLSFRGEDSRAKFISHLYASLQNAGINVFRDDDEIQRGDTISVSLLRAIRSSRISIIVFSKYYANSKWCMLELENIMETRRTMGLVVLPVFYEVDPSNVRHQRGDFGKAFDDLITKPSVDEVMVKNWRTALLEVGGMAGLVMINSKNESEDIMKVVENVTDLLGKTYIIVADHPVGVEARVQNVIQLLKSKQSEDPLVVGIWGMGKTTIAKAVYNRIRREFEAKSFLLNVREVCEQNNGLVSLQQKLLSDIYKTTKIKIDTVESGKEELKRRLSQKRIFLVLDDVNEEEQLNALCGSHEWFGYGSRIIITTRDENIVKKEFGVEVVYKIKEMDEKESLELFNWHAFKQPSPEEGFADLSSDVVKYCRGLPLALQVIGSFLLTRRRVTVWKSVR